ncbi:hypothetical protein RND81_10G013400 [Saponaria officinalis]|uniref:Transposase n=1 Tax=Saponaria officinalis TaxID=3572 RepID=A0AAW1HX23_SAPOF
MESFVNDNIASGDSGESGESDSLVELASSKTLGKRKRQGKGTKAVSTATSNRQRSQFHDHFVQSEVKDKKKCKYCSALIKYVPGNGTSALKSHTLRCKMFPANLDRKQKLIDFESQTITKEDGTTEVVSVPRLWQHDQNFSRKQCTKMIIFDELPFAHVEGEGFRDFCKAIQPEFIPPSRVTVTRDCYSLFIDERVNLKAFFGKLTSRVCLTTDTWTSGQNLSYMCLTAHFIDDSWVLHKRIINFVPIAGHSGEIIGRTIEQCLVEWNLKRILTYGLKDLHTSILKIRAAVRFVRSSPARAKCFKESVKEVSIKSKGLVSLDVDTRWNSTYLMLQSALKFKEAFANLSSKGGAYTRHLNKQLGVPNDSDWKAVETFLPFLEIFYDATLKVFGSLHVTSNAFLAQIVGVGSLISSYCTHENDHIRSMASKMKAKHDKYWGDVENLNILLFIAVILDLRHKWVFVEWTITDTYDAESADMLLVTIKKTLKSLFETYDTSSILTRENDEASSKFVSPSSLNRDKGTNKKVDAQQLLMDRFKKEKGTSMNVEKKSELDKYLSDDLEQNDDKFDLLGWWKDSSTRRYPIISKLAKDVLAMPISTVASESAFSTGGRVLDSFRTSLTPRIVEALICCQDWLRKSRGPLIIEERLADLEAIEESLEELSINQPQIVIDESLVVSIDDDNEIWIDG